MVHFLTLRSTLTDLWHPIRGIYITDIGDGRYLFKFFYDVELNRVLDGTPWFFNNHIIVIKR